MCIKETSDIVVVGGGLIGSSVAFRLAQSGYKVIVVDRGEPGREASSAAAGMLAAQVGMEKDDSFSRLCLSSRKIFSEFVREIEDISGTKIKFYKKGMLEIAKDEEGLRNLKKKFSLHESLGLHVESVSTSEVQKWGSGLDLSFQEGLFFPDDHWLDNESLTLGVVRAARKLGVKFISQMEIKKAEFNNQHLKELKSATHRFSANYFVLAAGCWSGELGKCFGLNVPVRPSRGQIIQLEIDRKIDYTIWCGETYLVPRSNGCLLVGATIEDAGFDKRVTVGGLREIFSSAVKLAPWLHQARFLRAWAGLRPDSTDHLPILGKAEILNLFFATGHFRNGILLAPITAQIISSLINNGTTSFSLDCFSLQRFSKRRNER